MIRCTDISIRFLSGRYALTQVSLGVAPGEMVGLLGPNGSGKTTLLRAVAGSISPQEGEVRVKGDAVLRLAAKERARRMAFVPQRAESIPDFTVFDLVLMGRYPHRKFLEDYTAADKEIALAALRETAVEHLAMRQARTLSGGELQRAYVARAFAQQTDVLLLDEASTGLDPAHAAAVFDRVRQRNKETGVTVLSAIHDLNLAALYCDRLVFLKNGALVADGPTRDIFTPETLAKVYDTSFIVFAHPECGLPQALLTPGEAHE